MLDDDRKVVLTILEDDSDENALQLAKVLRSAANANHDLVSGYVGAKQWAEFVETFDIARSSQLPKLLVWDRNEYEVNSGIVGCWFRCMVLKSCTNHNKLKVQYDDLQNADDSGKLEVKTFLASGHSRRGGGRQHPAHGGLEPRRAGRRSAGRRGEAQRRATWGGAAPGDVGRRSAGRRGEAQRRAGRREVGRRRAGRIEAREAGMLAAEARRGCRIWRRCRWRAAAAAWDGGSGGTGSAGGSPALGDGAEGGRRSGGLPDES
ncbi:hypothetical protein ABZP36_014126 [Zizania latifolia]